MSHSPVPRSVTIIVKFRLLEGPHWPPQMPQSSSATDPLERPETTLDVLNILLNNHFKKLTFFTERYDENFEHFVQKKTKKVFKFLSKRGPNGPYCSNFKNRLGQCVA